MASAPPSEREIIAEFNSRRQRLVDIFRKIEELSGEVNDHDTVIKALTPMESGRRCFRLIGEVLVERTVGETLPAVTRNKLQLEAAVQAMTDTVKTLEKQLADFQAKHKIKLVDKQGRPVESGEEEEDGGEASGSASSKAVSKGGQGVLRIGESRWRPLELCYWPEQTALPAKGKEYPGLGYKRLRDKPPKAQQQQQPPVAQ
ncbi:hypothetical protein QJQ45_011135 [Haematococcus lacustris]|nr:hypothetical protein QJQ45_011135 [Haematococcus lacustris]